MANFIKYEQSIVKIDKDGNKVLSDTLYDGEKVAHTGETYTQVKAARDARLTAESKGADLVHWKDDAKEPAVGSPTSTLDPSKISTVRGSYKS